MKQKLSVNKLLCASFIALVYSCSLPQAAPTTIRVRWSHDPETLDPLLQPNQVAVEASNLLHLGLLQFDFSRQQYAPALADSLPSIQLVGDSITKLHYHLRSAATWDNGRPVLASDVAFTLKLMLCPGLPNEATRGRFGFITAVLIDPADARRFTLVCRGKSLEYWQASGDFPILPESAIDPHGQLRRFSLADLASRSATATPDSSILALAQRYQAADPGRFPGHLPGCGPYQLVRWEKDQYLTFRRKPRWWADQLRPAPFVLRAQPQQLDYVIIPDAATATLALRRGDLDVYPQMPAREFARLRNSPAARKTLRFYSTASYDVVTAGFNTRRPALADALTRQALSRCFDAASLLRATQLGTGQRTIGIISPDDRTNYNDSLTPIPYDLHGAATLLRQAGWQRSPTAGTGWARRGPTGLQQLRLVVRYRADESLFATTALQFQAAAASIDIPVTLQPTESGAFTMALRTGDFDMYVRLLKGNPFMFNFTPVFHTLGIGAGNFTGFSTPASDRLIEAIAGADTDAHRAQLLRRFQALMQQEVPLVPLFFLPNRIAADGHLTGLHPSSLKPGYTVMTIERLANVPPAP